MRHHPAFFAKTFIWVMMISHIPDKQAKKSRIPQPYFGTSRFPGSRQILNPIKIFSIFLNPAPYFGQILDPENTLPDPGSKVYEHKVCMEMMQNMSQQTESHAGKTCAGEGWGLRGEGQQ